MPRDPSPPRDAADENCGVQPPISFTCLTLPPFLRYYAKSTHMIQTDRPLRTDTVAGTAVGGVECRKGNDAHLLTMDSIVKACVAQGFYRNPVCNEKLYLHGKGFTGIDPTALEQYTDVKVLWLEGNALRSLPCGAPLIQVRPPRRRTYLTSSDEDEPAGEEPRAETVVPSTTATPTTEEVTAEAVRPLAQHVDPTADGITGAPPEADVTPPIQATPLPAASSIATDQRDAFSSQYPTVRQLYLHNNIFPEMPDLSRFECLDSVNLSNNFITAVEPRCPYWAANTAECVAKEIRTGGVVDPSEDTAARTTSATADAQLKVEGGEADVIDASSLVVANAAVAQRQAELAAIQNMIDGCASLCQHTIRDTDEVGPLLPAHRNLCSSLRTLNLASNHLETTASICGLLCFKSLINLDLSQNRLTDGEALLCILERLPSLRSVKLSGNPLVRTLPRYRKQVISRCRQLLNLDDRPIFDDERRLNNAWALGGEAAEAQERLRIREENENQQRRRLDDFRAFINGHRTAVEPPTAVESGVIPNSLTAVDEAPHPPQQKTEKSEVTAKRTRRGRSDKSNSDPDLSPTSSESEEDEAVLLAQRVVPLAAELSRAAPLADEEVNDDIYVPEGV